MTAVHYTPTMHRHEFPMSITGSSISVPRPVGLAGASSTFLQAGGRSASVSAFGGFGRFGRRLGMQHLVGEPEVEVLAAAVAARHRRLLAAIRRIGRTFQPHMDVVGVAVPGPHLGHPGIVMLVLDAAQFLLDRGIDQHALDFRLLGRGLDEGDVRRRPGFRIDVLAVGGDQIAGGDILALFLAQLVVRLRHEPDVDVEADLVAHVAERQRAAARLRHVADQDALPAGGLGGERREALEEFDQFGMAPIAVARQPHHLPVRAVDRQFDAALQAAARVVADRHGLAEARQLRFREQKLGRQF